MNISVNKKKAFHLIKSLYKDKNTISVTLTGSYSEHFEINKAGDVDIIIVCKKLNKLYFNSCKKNLKKAKEKIFGKEKDLIINTTFGPIKFYKENSIVFHLMIYDLESHIDHTIKSPFTCYDWERSSINVGKKLKDLCAVHSLQLRDFYEARRNTDEYLNDIINNRISYREYKFNKKKYSIVKKNYKIDEINKRDFIYHTIKFLLINYIKYEKNKNFLVKDSNINKKFYEITKNKELLQDFKKLRILKKNKLEGNIENSKKLAIHFIKYFNKFIQKKIKLKNNLYFSRHKKTYINKEVFLGQKNNPNIIDKKITKELKNIKIDRFISSPFKRCVQTTKLLSKNSKIYLDKNLIEINYGDAENMTYKNFKIKYPRITRLWKKKEDPRFPNGESTYDVLQRLQKFLKKEIKIYRYKKNIKTLIITHNVVLRCLIGMIFSIRKSDWYKINIKYFDLLEFIYIEKKLRPNIDRKKFLDIFININNNLSDV